MSKRLKFAVFALWLAVPLAAAAVESNPLVAERWKTRPVVVVVPAPGDALLARVESALRQTATREAFLDREMVLYTVVGGKGRRNGRALSATHTGALLNALQLDPAGPPTFLLIGKDGGIKMTEGPDVDLQAVFAEIDRMPMRRR
ncbi:DUF4174 domain-containing protein [Variovorax ginsengisoli]|uniref:DUF4174 domain-containing protein n=1 Tax=Variovorax ginsengisoli TaxID=363844 RepID=A0ABT9S360_9BURK|nr:DUF4174 domain-containing protein [Variovorax ginsengisoli]MDP9898783.1 hypothetical protein [Variovorax ginsengisoli]